MASRPLAVVDATDLFPQDQRDFLVQAAIDGLYRIAWSDTLLQETACAIHRRLRERDGLSRRTATERMLGLLVSGLTTVGAGHALDENHIREQISALGDNPSGWGTTDPDDRHVVAAAVAANADVLVSSDTKFDANGCEQLFGFRVVSADRFLEEVFQHAHADHIAAPLDALASRWREPAQFTRAQVIGRLSTPLPVAMKYLVESHEFEAEETPSDSRVT